MRTAAIVAAAAFISGNAMANPDWSKVAPVKMNLIHPGQASLEWVMDSSKHSAVRDIVERKRACSKCHLGDATEVGDKIIKGQPVGVNKAPLEPKPEAGRAGFIPVDFQATHDGSKIYFRLAWESPKGGAAKRDAKNAVKATILLDGGGTVGGAELNGCWASCHDDLSGMRTAKDDKKTKYIKDANLAGGKFFDMIQFRSGGQAVDGHIVDKRVMKGGKSLVKAEGKKEGNKWVVTFERGLAGKGPGDHTIAPGKMYNFGVAIHEDHSSGRHHYVSFGYQFELDNKGKERYQLNVARQ